MIPVKTAGPPPAQSSPTHIPLKPFPGGPNVDDLASNAQVSVNKLTTTTNIWGVPTGKKPGQFTMTANSSTVDSKVNYWPVIQPGTTLSESSVTFQGSYDDAVESARVLNRRSHQPIGILSVTHGKYLLTPLKGDGPGGLGKPQNSRLMGRPMTATQVISTPAELERFVRTFPSDERWIDNALKNLPNNGAATYQQLITKVEPHNTYVAGLVLKDGYYDLRNDSLPG